MGKRAVRLFFRGLIISFFIVALLLGAGVLGYQLTMKTLKVPGGDAILAYQDDTVSEGITQASADDISKNLIYCYNEENGEITKIVLEVFDSHHKKLTYITIPMRTQLTMSDSLYRKMVLVNPEIPQVMLLSSMTKYLASDTVYDYGVLMLEELLGIKISYFTAIPQGTYDKIFTGKIPAAEAGTASADIKGQSRGQSLPVETFTDKYIKYIKKLKTKEKLRTYIESVYPDIKTNLPLEDKLSYLDSYLQTPLSNVSFELIKGTNQNSAFLIDDSQASERLLELTGDSTDD